MVGSGTLDDDVPGAPAASTSASGRRASTAAGRENAAPAQSLEAVGAVGLSGLRIGATLVAGDWPELGIAGLLWDGERLVAVSVESGGALGPLGSGRPPIAVALRGLRVVGTERRSGVPLVALGPDPGDVEPASAALAPPSSRLPDRGAPARWVAVVGRLVGQAPDYSLRIGGSVVALRIACEDVALPSGTVSVTGIGVAPGEVIVPCGGVRAAPTLMRVAATASDGKASRDADAAPAVAPDAPLEQRRTLPAALLLLGAAIASGSAAFARRRATAEPPGRLGEVEEAALESSDAPRLALVRLDRDGS